MLQENVCRLVFRLNVGYIKKNPGERESGTRRWRLRPCVQAEVTKPVGTRVPVGPGGVGTRDRGAYRRFGTL
jgi:hypothetical protein